MGASGTRACARSHGYRAPLRVLSSLTTDLPPPPRRSAGVRTFGPRSVLAHGPRVAATGVCYRCDGAPKSRSVPDGVLSWTGDRVAMTRVATRLRVDSGGSLTMSRDRAVAVMSWSIARAEGQWIERGFDAGCSASSTSSPAKPWPSRLIALSVRIPSSPCLTGSRSSGPTARVPPVRQRARCSSRTPWLTGVGSAVSTPSACRPPTRSTTPAGIVPHRVCQAISERAQAAGRRGVGCRSAQTPRGAGRELTWFPRPGAAGPAWSNARRSPRFWGR
jgi:hypothetical protein